MPRVRTARDLPPPNPGEANRPITEERPSAGIGPEQFRETMRQWAAGVTVITAGEAPRVHGMTANSFTPLSRTPPLILVCVDRKNDTHGMLKVGGRFGVNLLSDAQAMLSRQFATKTPERDCLDGLSWFSGPGGTLLFNDCAAVMECEVEQLHDGGDHTIVVGRIRWARADRTKSALIYSRGTYGRWISDIVELTVERTGTG